MEKLVTASLEDSDSFQEYEKTMLDICNAVGRDVLQRKLQKTSRQYTSEYILVDGQRYKIMENNGDKIMGTLTFKNFIMILFVILHPSCLEELRSWPY